MKRNVILTVLLILIVGVIVVLEYQRPRIEEIMPMNDKNNLEVSKIVAEKAKKYERAKEITTPDGYINTDGITLGELVGKKVILIDFWTYSCINCQRTFPYLNAWYDKYKDQGLEMIGIHTPEFKFEHEYSNVVAATARFGLKFPVVQDNDFSTWTAYRNRFWPRKYLIDIDGFIVYDHAGEGAYGETESKIQELLEERRVRLGLASEITSQKVSPENTEVVDPFKRRSPEIYFGAFRNERLGNGEIKVLGEQSFEDPAEPKLDVLYLSGKWKIEDEFAESLEPGTKIIFRYRAEKVFMVLSASEEQELEILRDGEPLAAESKGAHIELVDGKALVKVKEDKLYRLVEDRAGSGEHVLEIISTEPGLRAFTFTFG